MNKSKRELIALGYFLLFFVLLFVVTGVFLSFFYGLGLLRGGYTSGGAPEIVINPIPTNSVGTSPVVKPPIAKGGQ